MNALNLKQRFEIGASLIPPFALFWLASRAGWIPLPPKPFLIAMPCALAIGMLLAPIFAPWHRAFSRGQKWVGYRILAVLLAVIFVLAILPIGLLLRIRGRSFLQQTSRDSYWVPAARGSLKNQF